jgi:hypothetical protein
MWVQYQLPLFQTENPIGIFIFNDPAYRKIVSLHCFHSVANIMDETENTKVATHLPAKPAHLSRHKENVTIYKYKALVDLQLQRLLVASE